MTARTLVGAERYYYDGSNRLSKLVETNASGSITHKYEWTYDHNDNVVSLTETIGGKTYTYNYTYNDDQIATGVTYGATSEAIAFDGYGRTSSTTIKNNGTARLTTSYAYNSIGGYTTNQIGTLNNNYGGSNHNLTYTYDANGNILTVSDGTNTTTYTYDSLNQLLSEKNQAAGKSWVYTYDTGGNITSKTEYTNATASGTGTTTTYGYTDANWGDLLKTYGSKALTYDNSGNLKTFNGWTYTWQGGRQLKSMTNGSTTLNFAYNDAGLRTSKNEHKYYYQGNLLTADVTSTDALYFHYDANGGILGFTYVSGNTTAEYYYVKNLQGDVIGILDASGKQVASYTYNAWGQVLSVGGSNTTLANRNPIRYRGYVYDTESGLYYLQSRYYNPETGRFINADDFETLREECESAAQVNLFAYCWNNPTNKHDPNGYWTLAFAGGGLYSTAGVVGAASIWTPVGWVVIGAVAVASVIVVGKDIYDHIQTASNDKSDPYARPGQKKQGRERKNKARGHEDWEPRSNPRPPKKHTPGRGHRKYK